MNIGNIVSIGFIALLFILVIICVVIWIDDWYSARKRLQRMEPCPKCGSKRIMHCINASAGVEHRECMDCEHKFPITGERTKFCFCQDGYCTSGEMTTIEEAED